MLTAVPKSPFSSDFQIFKDDSPIALLDVSAWRNRGSIEINGSSLRVVQNGTLRPEFLLLRDDQPIASARKSSLMSSRLELHLGDVVCEIRRRRAFSGQFLVWKGEQQIGEIAKIKWYSKRSRIDLPEEWPDALQVFVFWLVLLIWKKEEAAAAGG